MFKYSLTTEVVQPGFLAGGVPSIFVHLEHPAEESSRKVCEKHDFYDEIGSPGFWGTLKINFRFADAANLVDCDPRIDIE